MITVIANHRGLNDAAAVGIVEKVISAVFLVPSSMLAAVSALAAQNIGAGKHDRVAKTLQYIHSYIWDCIFAGIHFSFTGYFCAYGKSYIGFIHNIIAIILVRIPGSYLASRYFPHTLFPMGMAAPAGSLLSVLICLIAYFWLKHHAGPGPVSRCKGDSNGR